MSSPQGTSLWQLLTKKMPMPSAQRPPSMRADPSPPAAPKPAASVPTGAKSHASSFPQLTANLSPNSPDTRAREDTSSSLKRKRDNRYEALKFALSVPADARPLQDPARPSPTPSHGAYSTPNHAHSKLSAGAPNNDVPASDPGPDTAAHASSSVATRSSAKPRTSQRSSSSKVKKQKRGGSTEPIQPHPPPNLDRLLRNLAKHTPPLHRGPIASGLSPNAGQPFGRMDTAAQPRHKAGATLSGSPSHISTPSSSPSAQIASSTQAKHSSPNRVALTALTSRTKDKSSSVDADSLIKPRTLPAHSPHAPPKSSSCLLDSLGSSSAQPASLAPTAAHAPGAPQAADQVHWNEELFSRRDPALDLVFRPAPAFEPNVVPELMRQVQMMDWENIFMLPGGLWTIPHDYPPALDDVPSPSIPAYEDGTALEARVGEWVLPRPPDQTPESTEASGNNVAHINIDPHVLAEGLEEGDELSALLQGKQFEPAQRPAPTPSPSASLEARNGTTVSARDLFSPHSMIAKVFVLQKVRHTPYIPSFIRMPLINALQGSGVCKTLQSKSIWAFDLGPYSHSNPGMSEFTCDRVFLTLEGTSAASFLFRADPVAAHLLQSDVRMSPWYDAEGYLVKSESGKRETDPSTNVLISHLDKVVAEYNKECTVYSKVMKRVRSLKREMTSAERSMKQVQSRLESVQKGLSQQDRLMRPALQAHSDTLREVAELEIELEQVDTKHHAQEEALLQEHANAMAKEQQEAESLRNQIAKLETSSSRASDPFQYAAAVRELNQETERLWQDDRVKRQQEQQHLRDVEIATTCALLDDPNISEEGRARARMKLVALKPEGEEAAPDSRGGSAAPDDHISLEDELAALANEAGQFESLDAEQPSTTTTTRRRRSRTNRAPHSSEPS